MMDTVFSFFPSNPNVDVQGLTQGTDGNFYGLSSELNAVFEITPAGSFSILATFDWVGGSMQPIGSLVRGLDGAFYGTTVIGGTNEDGSGFKITSARKIVTLYSFNSVRDGSGNNLDGLCPRAGLALGRDGNLYGTTSTGGSNGCGTVFKITPDGVLTSLYSFGALVDTNGSVLDGCWPATPLLEGSDGNYYGTTEYGGIGCGSVFKITASGLLTPLYQFPAPPSNVYTARTGEPTALIEGADGNLYGATTYGGSNYQGSIYQITANGDYTTLHSFSYAVDGGYPAAGLVVGRDGNLYGTASAGGPGGNGTIFRISPSGRFARLFAFNGGDGSAPQNLIQTKNGTFYGTTEHGGIFRMSPPATMKMLFQGTGWMPEGALIQGKDGNLYGVTLYGGFGTVFAVNPFGGFRSLCSLNGSNGANLDIVVSEGLVEGSDGYFYGTAPFGGINNNGTIYKVSPAGNLTTLVKFDGSNGQFPEGTLVRDGAEDFFGITFGGGRWSAGTVFKMSRSGHLTTVFDFDGKQSGGPSSLIGAANGDFYGTTWEGGNSNGTIFRINRSGQFMTLATLNGNDGAMPTGLVMSDDGRLFGTARGGGIDGNGTFFVVSSFGESRPVAFFGGVNGSQPNPPVLARDGNYYGTTSIGGVDGDGTLFRITLSGKLTSLADVGGSGRLVEGMDGAFYGTTLGGGFYNAGSVFRVAPSRYAGLFYDTNNIGFQSSGAFQLTVDLSLQVSGTLTLGDRDYSISGQVDSNLLASIVIHRSQLPNLTINLQFSETNDAVCGVVTDGDWTAQLYGLKPGLFNAANPAPEAGKYAVSFSTAGVDRPTPGDTGTGQVAVSAYGRISLAGTLPDRTVIRQTSSISSSGQWPLFVSLYGGRGSLLGWITFSNSLASQFSGPAIWIKATSNGFTNIITALGTPKDAASVVP